MKRKEIFFKKDDSFNSIAKLSRLIESYFCFNLKLKNFWIPDNFKPFPENSYDEILHVVFLGDFARKFLEASLWPHKAFKFYTISTTSKNVFNKLFKLDEQQVFNIPRYKLIPSNNKTAFIPLNEIEHLYYVGQIREEKNVLLLVWLTFFLNKNFGCKIKLHLVGKHNNEKFLESILNIFHHADFSIKPSYEGYIENFSFQHVPKNSLYINLSTFLYEDFNLSQAEAEAAGIYSILSGWGGHLDVSSLNSFLIPFQLIGMPTGNRESKIRAFFIAKFLNTSFKTSNILTKAISSESHVINQEDLRNIHLSLVSRFGFSLIFILRNHIYLLKDSHNGMLFLEEYIKIFSGNSLNYKKVLIINNLDEMNLNLESRIMNLNIDSDTAWVQLKDLAFKNILLSVISADQIYIPSEFYQLPSLKIIFESVDSKCLKI